MGLRWSATPTVPGKSVGRWRRTPISASMPPAEPPNVNRSRTRFSSLIRGHLRLPRWPLEQFLFGRQELRAGVHVPNSAGERNETAVRLERQHARAVGARNTGETIATVRSQYVRQQRHDTPWVFWHLPRHLIDGPQALCQSRN